MCTMSKRSCKYAPQVRQDSPSASSTSLEPSINSVDPHKQEDPALRTAQSSGGAASSRKCNNSATPSRGNDHDPALDDAINFNQMELFAHLILSREEMFNLAFETPDEGDGISLAVNASLESPFLLYQLLAFSACHLAFLRPERSAEFSRQAVALQSLQTRAVSLFNAAWTKVDGSNCVAVLLFSTALGHHLLADTLAKRTPTGLEAFIAHYVQCVELHRGIYTVAMSAWPLLMESHLEPVLSLSSSFTSRLPKGRHCQPIKTLLDSAEELAETDKQACMQSVHYLQIGFDAVFAKEEGEHGIRHQMIFLWSMLAPPELTRLLASRRPEVLVLLA
ncbi:hypothetical protein K402DRAFT_397322 [Aulographum hederae CBS 113979]|uniref:Uncharacterized protein n=1 Tax=Aulographum hederae CBS 113979 TaxID=1176131 RepID=A0A6G1GNP9_9PEZI|nr:hypothetical protein K402DRAFT_397322 [Aulographum hederae CBS 113979]